MNPEQKTPGINCPTCGQFIPTTITELITSKSLNCPYCGLQLNIDRQKSQSAIEALQKVNHAQQEVEARSHFNR